MGLNFDRQVLDTARTFPPEQPESVVHVLLLPCNADEPIRAATVSAEDAKNKGIAAALAPLLAAREVDKDGKEMQVGALPPVSLGRIPNFGGGGSMLAFTGQGEVNARASAFAGVAVRGNACFVRRRVGSHLYAMLRPELLQAWRQVSRAAKAGGDGQGAGEGKQDAGQDLGAGSSQGLLSSDAFSMFGRHDAKVHNGEVAAATQHLISVVIPQLGKVGGMGNAR